MSTDEPNMSDPLPGAADQQMDQHLDQHVDQLLQESGQRLRENISPVHASSIIVQSLRSQLRSARLSGLILGGLSLLLAAALVTSLLTRPNADGAKAKSSLTPGGDPNLASLAAIRLVDSLPPDPVDPHKVKLVASVMRYNSCDSLIEKLHRTGAEHVGSLGFGNIGTVLPFDAGQPHLNGLSVNDISAVAGSGTGAEGQTRSMALSDEEGTQGTNVIVEGVDEPDSVKAVGSLVIDLVGSKLRVTDTAVPAVVGTVDLSPGTRADDAGPFSSNDSLIVQDDRVVVFGSEMVPGEPVPDDPSAARPYRSYLTVTFVDLSNPKNPTVTDRVRVEGYLVAARAVGSQVRIVTNSDLADLPMVLPSTVTSVSAALRQNRLAVADSTTADWIPDWDRGDTSKSAPLVECDGVVVPDTFAGVQMTSLVEFDIDKPFQPRAMSILAPSENITASANEVVVASHIWVDPAKQKGDFSDWATALHRFEFNATRPDYIGSGSVDGSVRDSFSLSLLDGESLGVITVDMVPWAERDNAQVTIRVLTNNRPKRTLSEVGALEPETAKADIGGVRFIGDHVLLSTGPLRADLVSVDVGDREHPIQQGAVAMGGSGEYIHPIAENRILVIGATLRNEGTRLSSGIQAIVIDLSSAPTVVSRWAQDAAYTSVGYDYHEFTWWRTRSVAAFAVQRVPALASVAPPPQAAFLDVDDDAITPRIVTPQNADLGPKCRFDQPPTPGCDGTGDPLVLRVLIINDSPWLYTSESVEHLHPESLTSLGLVPLPER